MASRDGDLDLQMRGAEHAVERYAKEHGAAATDLLMRAIREGCTEVRHVAVRLLAALDASLAESFVAGELEAMQRAGTNERLLAVHALCLFELGTTASLDRVLALAIDREPPMPLHVAGAPPARVAALFERLRLRLPAIERVEAALSALDVMAWLDRPALGIAARRDLALALVHDVRLEAATRDRAAEVLLDVDDEGSYASIREGAGDVPFKLRARALLAGDPRHAFDELAPTFRGDPLARDPILRHLDRHADPRWAQEVLALVDDDPPGFTSVLGRIGAGDELCDLAVRPSLDRIAQCALYALRGAGDPRASALLLWWLDTPEGHERAPMLLTALGECGDLDAAGVLEAKLAQASARHEFYRHAIDAIRHRHQPALVINNQ